LEKWNWETSQKLNWIFKKSAIRQNGNWKQMLKRKSIKIDVRWPRTRMEETHLKHSNAPYKKSMKPPKNWQSISIETIQDYQQRQDSKQCYSLGPWPNSSGIVFNDSWVVTSGDETEQNRGDYHIISHRLQNHIISHRLQNHIISHHFQNHHNLCLQL